MTAKWMKKSKMATTYNFTALQFLLLQIMSLSGNECTQNADSASDPGWQSAYVAVEGNLAL